MLLSAVQALIDVPTHVAGVAPMLQDASGLTTIIEWFKDPETLLVAMGPWVMWGTLLIVFIESGVLFPVLPGDSLLFTAGLLHDRLGLNLPMFIGLVFIAAFLGGQVGYWLGRKYGRRLFKDDARFLKTEHLAKAENYFNRYGGRALVIGRFIPFVRTFITLAAGMARYEYKRFLFFNSLGALLWGVGITYAGSLLGGIPFFHDHITLIILLIVFVSVIPMIVEAFLARRRSAHVEPMNIAADVVEESGEPVVVSDQGPVVVSDQAQRPSEH